MKSNFERPDTNPDAGGIKDEISLEELRKVGDESLAEKISEVEKKLQEHYENIANRSVDQLKEGVCFRCIPELTEKLNELKKGYAEALKKRDEMHIRLQNELSAYDEILSKTKDSLRAHKERFGDNEEAENEFINDEIRDLIDKIKIYKSAHLGFQDRSLEDRDNEVRNMGLDFSMDLAFSPGRFNTGIKVIKEGSGGSRAECQRFKETEQTEKMRLKFLDRLLSVFDALELPAGRVLEHSNFGPAELPLDDKYRTHRTQGGLKDTPEGEHLFIRGITGLVKAIQEQNKMNKESQGGAVEK